MAVRPLTFGVRLKQGKRSARVRQSGGGGYVVEDRRADGRKDLSAVRLRLRVVAGALRRTTGGLADETVHLRRERKRGDAGAEPAGV